MAMRMVSLRLDDETITLLDEHVRLANMLSSMLGMRYTRSDSIRHLIHEGIASARKMAAERIAAAKEAEPWQ